MTCCSDLYHRQPRRGPTSHSTDTSRVRPIGCGISHASAREGFPEQRHLKAIADKSRDLFLNVYWALSHPFH